MQHIGRVFDFDSYSAYYSLDNGRVIYNSGNIHRDEGTSDEFREEITAPNCRLRFCPFQAGDRHDLTKECDRILNWS